MTTPTPPLSLEEQAALTSGSGMWTTKEIPGKVRSLLLTDGPHGIRKQPSEGGDNLGIGGSAPATCFPPAVALGSTWNPQLLREVGEALGVEARALGVDVLLGPGLNIKRSPLGGRNFEYLSEDPHISGTLAGAMVDGIQSQGVAATPKHFAVNNQETDRMRVDAQVDEVTLRELYLRGFETVVREHKPWALMCAYNKINGVYASQDRWLLTEVLRDEWGFDGLVMSDWGAVNDRVAAVSAGLDLEMPPSGTDETVVAAVRSGELDPDVLDTVAQRMQQLADRTAPAAAAVELPIDEHDALARRAAGEAVVMLKNDGVLPWQGAPGQRVVVIGPFAHSPRYQGGGSSRVVPTRLHTFEQSFPAAVGPEVSVVFHDGYAPDAAGSDREATRAELAELTSDADLVIVFVGQPANAESEGYDRDSLALPESDLALLADLSGADALTTAPVLTVVSGGGAVELDDVVSHSDAVLAAWLLGQAGGAALTDIVLGAVNPSGRLAESLPHRLQDNPSYLTFPGRDSVAVYGEGRYVGYRYYDALDLPVAFPFGYGLSYTSFAYTDLQVEAVGQHEWQVSFTLSNTGPMPGAEVPQLYLTPPPREGEPAVHELRAFDKVWLEAGESQTVTLRLQLRDVSRWDVAAGRWLVAAGEHILEVGASSRDIRLTDVLQVEGDGWIPPLTEWHTIAEWAEHPLGREVIDQMRSSVPQEMLDNAPELLAMFMQQPMIKIAVWPVGPSAAELTDLVATLEQRRRTLLTP